MTRTSACSDTMVPALTARPAVEVDLAGEDQRLGAFARLDEAAPHQQLIEAQLHRVSTAHDRRSTIQRAIAARWPSARPAPARAASARATASAASAFDRATPNSAG